MPLFLISVLLHAYVGWRVAPDLPGTGWAWTFSAVVAASALLMPMALLARRVRQPWSDRLAWAGALAMGLFSSLFVLTLARDALLLLGAGVGLAARARSTRRRSRAGARWRCRCSA